VTQFNALLNLYYLFIPVIFPIRIGKDAIAPIFSFITLNFTTTKYFPYIMTYQIVMHNL